MFLELWNVPGACSPRSQVFSTLTVPHFMIWFWGYLAHLQRVKSGLSLTPPLTQSLSSWSRCLVRNPRQSTLPDKDLGICNSPSKIQTAWKMAWVSKEQHHPPQAQHHPCPHHDKQTEWHFVLPGPSNLHLSRHEPPPPVASTTCEHYDVQFPVPPNRTVVRYGQLSDAMPEQTCFTICSNFTQSDARAVGLDKNLAGHGVEHGVAGCSPSSVSGHQQSESARPPCQSYAQPNCLSAAQSAFSSLV